MPVLFKDDKTCKCDLNQVPAMEAAGWSRKRPEAPKPKAKKAKKVEEPVEEETAPELELKETPVEESMEDKGAE